MDFEQRKEWEPGAVCFFCNPKRPRDAADRRKRGSETLAASGAMASGAVFGASSDRLSTASSKRQ